MNQTIGRSISRRRVITGIATAGVAAAMRAASARSLRAVAFDAFAIFDPRPVSAAAEMCFPGRGAEFMNAWRTRQFEYTWLRTIAGDYADFEQVTVEALAFAADLLRLRPTPEQKAALLESYFRLSVWPDSTAALQRLEAAGLRLVLLSNFTPSMLDAAVDRNQLAGVFESRLSTDRVRAFKPDPRAYRMARDAMRLKRTEIAFAAFAGWDAAGAKAFGYPTFWVNRMAAPAERLGREPDAAGANLEDLARFVLSR